MKIIDLTLELYDGLVTNGQSVVGIKEQCSIQEIKDEGAQGFESRSLSFSDHSGTHVDALSHIIKNGESAEQIQVGKMFGDSLVLDVSPFKKSNEPITKDILENAEQSQGVYVVKNDIVLIKTSPKNGGEDGLVETAALAKSGAEWVIEKEIQVVGIDLPSIAAQKQDSKGIHQQLLSNDIYIIESLVNLDQLPIHSRFLFFGIPLKLKGATASPIRALSILNSQLI